ncbi:hypothetical protein IWW54_000341 [Coemansia sp. RSA 2705]|nr:hypothetical protein IWW54_000341 [Coemansia sp. RSA 2705]
MTTFQQKSVFVNAALALIALTYIYRVFTSRVEVFGVGTHPSSANTTSCYNKHVHSRFEAEDNVIVMDENNNLQVLRLVELDRSSNTLVPFTQEFRVHGFDIYWDSIDPTELTFMFVNHQRTGAGISIFRHRIGTKFLQFVKTVKSPLLYAPNDVVATSRSTFYATNDMRSTSRVMRKIEMLLGMPWGHVVYYGHEGMVIKAAAGISYPNGIARSADGNTIFVAASSEPSVNMYRPRLDGSLELVGKTVFRNFVPDNVSVDTATGQVLVSGKLRGIVFM